MRYDPNVPRAVFLGPSLPPAVAARLLPANYYPPARMGDVYRLLASGVETIVIIDGVFHQSTPVWQREILAALEAGIRVVGGASMGALRAAELGAYGMEGIGTIYAWYRDGVLDGDDEVALVHADAELDYQALSEPLVNMRHNLARARAQALIDDATHDALLDAARQRCFTERSWRRLEAAPAWQALAPARRTALASFIANDYADLKRADALAVLEHVRSSAAPGQPTPRPRSRWSYPGSARVRLQAALAPDGSLVDGASVLSAALAADDSWAAACLREAHARSYLEDWLERRDALPPAATLAPFLAAATPPPARADATAFARSNGLTGDELAAALAARARHAWLLAQDDATLGVDGAAHDTLLDAIGDTAADARATARRDACLAAWARLRGISCPVAEHARRSAAWCAEHGLPATAIGADARLANALAERVLAAWLLDQQPAHFGFERFSADAELLLVLRLDGRLAALVTELTAGRAAPGPAGEDIAATGAA